MQRSSALGAVFCDDDGDEGGPCRSGGYRNPPMAWRRSVLHKGSRVTEILLRHSDASGGGFRLNRI